MDYLEVVFDTKGLSCSQVEIIIAELYLLGFVGFEERSSTLIAFLEDKNVNLLEIDFKTPVLSVNKMKNTNWNHVWESSFNRVVIDDLCVIRASFHKKDPKIPIDIIINPKMSFGTGHHPTTFLMIQRLLDIHLVDKRILDIGCGTGVLSILAEKKGARSIFGLDIDENAFLNSLENIKINNCKKISVFQTDINGFVNSDFFDLILVNINKNVLLDEMENYVERLSGNGMLILSGFFQSDFNDINSCVSRYNLTLELEKQYKKWQCLVYRK